MSLQLKSFLFHPHIYSLWVYSRYPVYVGSFLVKFFLFLDLSIAILFLLTVVPTGH
jgi:hypothetical protein